MITIIIPLYNGENSIIATLDSVLKQTINNFEVIIVNDCSTDNSENICKSKISNDSRFKFINHAKNLGVSAARNTGIVNANFDLIAFLDADDIWKNIYLENILYLNNKFPEAVAYATLFERILKYGNQSELISKPFETNKIRVIDNYASYHTSCNPQFYTSSIVVKKNILLKINLFKNNIKCGEDILAWIKISIYGKIILFEKASVVYNMSINANGRLRRKNDDYDQFAIEINLITNDIGIKNAELLLSNWHSTRFLNYLVTEKRHMILTKLYKEFKLSINYNPWNFKKYILLLLLPIPSNIIDKYILYRK